MELTCLLCYESSSSTQRPPSLVTSWSASLLKILGIGDMESGLDGSSMYAGFELATYCNQCLVLASECVSTMTQIEELQRALSHTTALIEKKVVEGYRGAITRAQDNEEGLSIAHPITMLRQKLYEEIQYRYPDEGDPLSSAFLEFQDFTHLDAVSVKEEPEDTPELSISKYKKFPAQRPRRKLSRRINVPEHDHVEGFASADDQEEDKHDDSDDDWMPDSKMEDYEAESDSNAHAEAQILDEPWQTTKPSDSTVQAVLRNPPSVSLQKLSESSVRDIILTLKKSVGLSMSRKDCPTCFKVFNSAAQRNIHERKVHAGVERPFQCKECPKNYKTRSHLRGHFIMIHTTEQPFQCRRCPKSFKMRKLLNAHSKCHGAKSDSASKIDRSTNNGSVSNCCSICKKSFKTHGYLTHHMRLHELNSASSNSKKCPDPACHKYFFTDESRDGHYNSKHLGIAQPYKCNNCENSYSTASHLKTHKLAKHSEGLGLYKCPKCDKSFTHRPVLRYHILNLCEPDAVPVTCETCSKVFSNQRLLNRHVKSMHSKPLARKYACAICAKSFTRPSDLENHHRVHTGERPFVCDICNLTFTSAQYLKYHKLAKHEKSDSLKCPECDKRFMTKINLNKHRAFLHRQEYQIHCGVCNKGMYNNKQLRLHMSTTHGGEPKLSCDHCEKTFADQHYLNLHLKRHEKKMSNQRDHVCDICGKGFLDSHDLSRHKAIHLGEKKFVCEVCGKAFPVKNYLYIHMRSHNRLNEGTWGWGFKKSESTN